MAARAKNKKRLQETLNEITAAGIQADGQQLKKDMRAQFSNYREWIREYVVNAYDALASYCRISGEKHGDEITVTVEDDGKGMDKQRIRKFFTLYASEKDLEAGRAIGTHGIGKLSVAAIPGQVRFEMETSDGREAWLAKAGKLDGMDDIHVRQLNTRIPRGSTFRVTFKSKNSLVKEMTLLKEILVRYTRFLPLQIAIAIPVSDHMDEPEDGSKDGSREKMADTKCVLHAINENWNACSDTFSREYVLELDGNSYEVMLNLGNQLQEIYQQRVLISSKYDLLSRGLKEDWALEYLSIRVNSSSFELPFGRHCLRDENILQPLSRKIRNNLLPQYLTDLYKHMESLDMHASRQVSFQVDALSCRLIALDHSLNKPWSNYAFIRTMNLGKISFKELWETVKSKGRFFIEDESNAGIDYTSFNDLVLQHEQAEDLIKLLETLFKDRCILLKGTDLVFEKYGTNQELNELQKTFERNLGFHPELFSEGDLSDEPNRKVNGPVKPTEQSYLGQGLFNEVEEACQDLCTLKWKAGFLVEKDLTSPCFTHLFIYSNHTIILNLYHPLIEKLVALSAVNPRLAGHWGVSLCLLDSRNVFPYLSADTRKELLMLDGMAKLGSGKSRPQADQDRKAYQQLFSEFRRNLNENLKKHLN